MTRLFMEPIDAVSSALSAIRGPSLRAGILAALLGLAPSALKAASAIGAGLIPAMLSLVSVGGTLRLLLGNLSKDIKSQTLKQLDAMADGFKELAREAAKPGLNRFFAAAVRLAPLLRGYVRQIAAGIGQVGRELADLMDTPAFRGKLQTLLEGTARATRAWLGAVDAVVDMVVTLGAAAVPIFERFARAVASTAERWRDWLNLKASTGELARFLKEAGSELARWGRIVTNIIVGLHNVFAAGVGPSSRFAESLERMTKSFRDWTESSANVEKVRRFFQWMVDHVDDFFRVAASAAAIALALKGIGAAVGVVQWGVLLATLGPVGIALGLVGAALAAVAAGAFLAYNNSELFRAGVGELWTMLKERALPLFKEWWAWVTEKLAPALEDFADVVLEKVKDALDKIITAWEDNKDGIMEFADMLVKALPAAAAAVGVLIDGLTRLITTAIKTAGWIGRLIGWIKKVPGKAGTVFRFITTGVKAAIDRVKGWIRGIPGKAKTVFQFAVGGVKAAIDRLKGWLSSIPRSVVTNITQSITRTLNPFARASGGLVGAQGMQTGGISGGRAVLVGERGPELAELPFGSRVVPAGQTRTALAGGKHGGEQRIVLEFRSGGSRFDDLFLDLLRKGIRSRGGNVQVVLGGR